MFNVFSFFFRNTAQSLYVGPTEQGVVRCGFVLLSPLCLSIYYISECTDIKVVGWNSAARALIDAQGWTIVFSGKVIPCDGVVSQWTYWALVSQPFRAIVWRPTAVDTQFHVVGINDIPAGPINEAVVYTVPRDERINVKQGDVIGVGWSDSSPQITWSRGENTAAASRWYRQADPSNLQVGDSRSTSGAQDRSWSFSALVHSAGKIKSLFSFTQNFANRTVDIQFIFKKTK